MIENILISFFARLFLFFFGIAISLVPSLLVAVVIAKHSLRCIQFPFDKLVTSSYTICMFCMIFLLLFSFVSLLFHELFSVFFLDYRISFDSMLKSIYQNMLSTWRKHKKKNDKNVSILMWNKVRFRERILPLFFISFDTSFRISNSNLLSFEWNRWKWNVDDFEMRSVMRHLPAIRLKGKSTKHKAEEVDGRTTFKHNVCFDRI